MIRYLALIGLLAFCQPARAVQGRVDLGPFLSCNGCFVAPSYDDSELGKAMTICGRHEVPSSTVILTNPPQQSHDYPSDWQACFTVRAKWEASEAGRKAKEAAEQERRDLEFVEKVAKGK